MTLQDFECAVCGEVFERERIPGVPKPIFVCAECVVSKTTEWEVCRSSEREEDAFMFATSLVPVERVGYDEEPYMSFEGRGRIVVLMPKEVRYLFGNMLGLGRGEKRTIEISWK